MSTRASSLQATNLLAINREIDSKYDAVLAVRDKLTEIELVAGLDIEQILVDLQEAQDFTGINVVAGDVAAWDPVTKTITVPTVKGDTGAQGQVTLGTTLAATDIPELNASKITSGTLPVVRGGTGVTTSTGTGSVVLSASPTLTTPNIGVATGTSFNSITGLSATTPLMNGTAAVGTGVTVARADHVHPTDTSRAPLASPAFTGTPTAPTPTAGDNSTKVATTAFATGQDLGVGQTWQDVAASRDSGVTYTNTTGKPIVVHLLWSDATGASFYINGEDIGGIFSGSGWGTIDVVVPNGATYGISAGENYNKWFELR